MFFAAFLTLGDIGAGVLVIPLMVCYTNHYDCNGMVKSGMRFDGILIGAAAFIMIGILHPVVIKAEYHWGTGVWPLFLAAGLACMVASLFIATTALSAILGTLGFSLLWSIRELFEQRERVKKGWFPKKPKQK